MTTFADTFEMERSLDIALIGDELLDSDFYETPYLYGDDVHYTTKHFVRHTFRATGFSMVQNGGVITGMFPATIDAVVIEVGENGEQLDRKYNDGDIARAVLAKLGPIPQFEGALRACVGA